jgi:hypothetical protein
MIKKIHRNAHIKHHYSEYGKLWHLIFYECSPVEQNVNPTDTLYCKYEYMHIYAKYL